MTSSAKKRKAKPAAPDLPPPLPPAPPWVIAIFLAVFAVLLFARLGHYALWDDETMVGLVAKGVDRTGDTSVLMDHGNIVAYRNGLLVRHFCDRSTPPLATYITAASFALFGDNAWAARWPFALFGLGAYALMLLGASRRPWPELVVLALGLLGNVSLLLNFRQCRYYAPSIFFCVAIVLVYACWKPKPRTLLVMAALSILLFVSNYLEYVAFYGCLVIDYVFWHRREWRLRWRDLLLLFGPQVVVNGLVSCVWNPLLTGQTKYETANSLADRFILLSWYWRDVNAAEFLVLPLMVLALVLGLVWKWPWLVRGCVAVAVFLAVITLLSPQPLSQTVLADIRYVTPIIPLAVAVEAGAICLLLGRWPWLAVGAAVLIFGGNFFNGGLFFDSGLRSTIASYVGELLHPVPEPYTPTADWINANVPEGESVWVLPDYSTYPLMFAAPRALYAWQLDWPPRADFAQLPAIHFKGQVPPDYLVAFGPFVEQMAQALQSWNRPDLHYEQVATLPVFWKDLYRPELFWRSFTPVTGFDPNQYGVHIFKRTNPPIVAP